MSASLAELQAAVDLLRKQNRDLRDELEAIARHDVSTFRCFQALPVELRKMIWQHACRTPQMYVIMPSALSRSKINGIIDTCQESRTVAKSLHLEYVNYIFNGPKPQLGMKNYVNLDLDTFWFITNLWHQFPPRNLQWRCSNEDLCSGCQQLPSIGLPTHVKRLAVNFSDWVPPSPKSKYLEEAGTMQLLHWIRVEELLIVVGSHRNCEGYSDVIFESPSKCPITVFLDPDMCGMPGSGPWLDRHDRDYDSWSAIESAMVEYLDSYQAARSAKAYVDAKVWSR